MITPIMREATVEDLPHMSRVAQVFYASSEHLIKFELNKFCELWTSLLASGTGIIYALFVGDDIVGVLGGIKHRDPYNSDTVASEMFWFVLPQYRGSGLNLLNAFEQWAKHHGCVSIKMAYLVDSMPEKVRIIYKRRKYKEAEHIYIKYL